MWLCGWSESPIGLNSLVDPSGARNLLKISGMYIFPMLQLRAGLLILIWMPSLASLSTYLLSWLRHSCDWNEKHLLVIKAYLMERNYTLVIHNTLCLTWTSSISYSLPALHPELKVWFMYVLEDQCLAISTSGTYAIIPTSHKIHICCSIHGHLCVLDATLYQ